MLDTNLQGREGDSGERHLIVESHFQVVKYQRLNNQPSLSRLHCCVCAHYNSK